MSSAEKFARWRILVTAAESWRWEEEEAARRVPLGREMDMADVDFGWRGKAAVWNAM